MEPAAVLCINISVLPVAPDLWALLAFEYSKHALFGSIVTSYRLVLAELSSASHGSDKK